MRISYFQMLPYSNADPEHLLSVSFSSRKKWSAEEHTF